MIWRTTALCVLLATAGGSALLFVTREVRERERVYSKLQTRISETRETSHVLSAEWAYLNRLDRIRELRSTKMKLVTLTHDRIARQNGSASCRRIGCLYVKRSGVAIY